MWFWFWFPWLLVILNSSSCTLLGCLNIFFGRIYIFNKFLFNTDSCFTYYILITTSSKQVANSCTQTHYSCYSYYEFLSIEFLPRHYSSLSPTCQNSMLVLHSSFQRCFISKTPTLCPNHMGSLLPWAPITALITECTLFITPSDKEEQQLNLNPFSFNPSRLFS